MASVLQHPDTAHNPTHVTLPSSTASSLCLKTHKNISQVLICSRHTHMGTDYKDTQKCLKC